MMTWYITVDLKCFYGAVTIALESSTEITNISDAKVNMKSLEIRRYLIQKYLSSTMY